MGILASWLILSVSVWFTAAILPGFEVRGFWGAIKVAAIFGLLNWFIGWLFFAIIAVGTLGIGLLLAFVTRWLVAAILLKITDAFSSSLSIVSFGRAFLAAMIMSALGTAGEYVWMTFVH